jgi:putative sugar O-methyltransferase
MFQCLQQGNATFLPSRFWQTLNQKHLADLQTTGFEYFKQTLASNYFTWLIGPGNNQFRFLREHTRRGDWPAIVRPPYGFRNVVGLGRRQQWFLQIYTRMLWRFVEQVDTEGVLKRLEEPVIGSPFPIMLDGRRISQDLANSVLEYYSVRERFDSAPGARFTICELGAGYGRNAFVFLSLYPACRYLVVDIPPALLVAQRYLASLFPERRVFPFRCFHDLAAVAGELEQAEIAFLLPHQAAMLPAKSVDLFLNISSLHEMHPEQIAAYVKMIDRLTSGLFYSKQWLVSTNAYDNQVVTKDDYPVPTHWRELFSRPAKVQTTFFEALYAIP